MGGCASFCHNMSNDIYNEDEYIKIIEYLSNNLDFFDDVKDSYKNILNYIKNEKDYNYLNKSLFEDIFLDISTFIKSFKMYKEIYDFCCILRVEKNDCFYFIPISNYTFDKVSIKFVSKITNDDESKCTIEKSFNYSKFYNDKNEFKFKPIVEEDKDFLIQLLKEKLNPVYKFLSLVISIYFLQNIFEKSIKDDMIQIYYTSRDKNECIYNYLKNMNNIPILFIKYIYYETDKFCFDLKNEFETKHLIVSDNEMHEINIYELNNKINKLTDEYNNLKKYYEINLVEITKDEKEKLIAQRDIYVKQIEELKNNIKNENENIEKNNIKLKDFEYYKEFYSFLKFKIISRCDTKIRFYNYMNEKKQIELKELKKPNAPPISDNININVCVDNNVKLPKALEINEMNLNNESLPIADVKLINQIS